MKFKKKPVVIDAIRWSGEETQFEEILNFMPPENLPSGVGYIPTLGTIDIPTLEGVMTASPGDWIIKGIKGEYYPVKNDIFEASYERTYEEGV